MATISAPASIARQRPRAGRRGGLGMGLATLYLSAVVLIPLAAVAVKALDQRPADLWASLVLIVGKVQIASIVIFADIESDAAGAAASLSLALIVASLIVLVLIRRLGGKVAH